MQTPILMYSHKYLHMQDMPTKTIKTQNKLPRTYYCQTHTCPQHAHTFALHLQNTHTHTLKEAQLAPLLGPLQKVFSLSNSLCLIRRCSRGQAVANNRY